MTKQSYRLDVDKIKTLKDVRNVFDNLHLLGYYDADDPNDENYHLCEYFTILQEPQELTFSAPRKTLEELQQELDEKFEKLLVKTKRKFAVSKESAEYHYNQFCKKQDGDFEYAKTQGYFPKLTFGTIGGTLDGSYLITNSSGAASWSSNYVLRPDNMGVGYWEIQPNVQVWLKQKPTWIVRKCAKIFFDFGWKDAK